MAMGNGERYYSPELGRFIQQDSLIGLLEVPQSLNRYAYTVNNPLKHTDPTGHIAPLIVIGAIALIAGAGIGGAYSYEMQNAEIADGLRKPEDFSWGEVAWGAGLGALMGVGATAVAVAFPVTIPVMIAGGFITSGSQIIKGHCESEAGYKNVGYVEQKYGVIGMILSLIGARSALKGGVKPNAAPKVLEESPTTIKTQPKQLGDGGVQERINSGRLLNAAPDEVVNSPKQTRFIADENGGVSDLQTGGRGNLNIIPKGQEPISLTSNGLPPRPPNSPNYSVAFRAKLKEGIDYPGKSEETHFQESNKQLYKAMKDTPEFGKQIEQEYPGLKEAISPGARGAYPRKPPTEQGLTWHHHAEEKGIMELIPREQHRAPGRLQEILHPHQKGGMENWGGGRKRNK